MPVRTTARRAVVVLLLAGAALPSTVTGAQAAAGGPIVALSVAATDGLGHHFTARMSCRGDRARATGYLHARAAAACRQARRIASFLAAVPPSGGRTCTEIYGGPDAARIRGTIGSRSVDRAFARIDGCEIDDWNFVGVLMPRSRFPAARR